MHEYVHICGHSPTPLYCPIRGINMPRHMSTQCRYMSTHLKARHMSDMLQTYVDTYIYVRNVSVSTWCGHAVYICPDTLCDICRTCFKHMSMHTYVRHMSEMYICRHDVYICPDTHSVTCQGLTLLHAKWHRPAQVLTPKSQCKPLTPPWEIMALTQNMYFLAQNLAKIPAGNVRPPGSSRATPTCPQTPKPRIYA